MSRVTRVDHGAVLLEAAEATFGSGWPAAGRAAAQVVILLVAVFGDGRGDTAAARVGPDRAGAVALVGDHPYQAPPGPPRPCPGMAGSADPRHHLLEHHAIVDIAATQHDRQRTTATVTGEGDLVVVPPRDRPTD
jgi:plasmid stabilization system protein ParE